MLWMYKIARLFSKWIIYYKNVFIIKYLRNECKSDCEKEVQGIKQSDIVSNSWVSRSEWDLKVGVRVETIQWLLHKYIVEQEVVHNYD